MIIILYLILCNVILFRALAPAPLRVQIKSKNHTKILDRGRWCLTSHGLSARAEQKRKHFIVILYIIVTIKGPHGPAKIRLSY